MLHLSSCTSDYPIENSPPGELTHQKNVHVSMESAASKLTKLIGRLNNDTRGTTTISIGQGIALDRHQHTLTRADENAWFYYFPIDDGAKFAIMGARNDIPALFAYGNNSPVRDNPEALIPDSINWNINSTLLAAQQTNDSIVQSLSSTYPDMQDSVTIVYGDPFFLYAQGIEPADLCPVKWDQDKPFNNLCPQSPYHPESNAPTCCLATAVAQLFACEKLRPSCYKNIVFDWDNLSQLTYASQFKLHSPHALQVSQLMLELGKPENLNVDYCNTEYVSVAYPTNVQRTLKNFGIYNSGQYRPFSSALVIEDLKRGYPVITSGWDETGGGHTWIIDGVITMVTPIYTYIGTNMNPTEVNYMYSYYFGVNWGWSAHGDGYYLETGFYPTIGPDFNPHNYPTTTYCKDGLNIGVSIQYGVKMTSNE